MAREFKDTKKTRCGAVVRGCKYTMKTIYLKTAQARAPEYLSPITVNAILKIASSMPWLKPISMVSAT